MSIICHFERFQDIRIPVSRIFFISLRSTNMAWLNPNFLWALLVLLIPVAIHLFNFRRYKKIEFSNVRLLTQIDQQTKSGNQLKKYLILASRLLAFTFLVLAFAQPILINKEQGLDKGKKNISIILDNSYSMNLSGEEGQLLEAAKNRARAIVNASSNADEFNVITADLNATFLHFRGKQATLENIDKIKISAASRPLNDLIQIQERLLKDRSGNKYAYCISDFQKKNSSLVNNRTDSSINKTWIKLESPQHDNICIDTCFLTSPIIQAGQNIGLVVQVSNYSNNTIEDLTLELWVNGKPKGLANFNIQAFNNDRQTINFTLENGGVHKCELKLPGDNIAIDDVLYFSMNINRSYSVNVISENGEKYADAVFSDNPGFIYKAENGGNINFSAFKNHDLIVLQGLNSIQSGLQSELDKFVKNGGTLFVFPGTEKDAETSGLKALSANFGVSIADKAEVEDIKVSALELQHPIYQNVFEKIPKNPDYPRISKRFDISSNSGNTLARLASGKAFLIDMPSGKGHYILCASALDKSWTNFQNHALFPPTLLKSAMLGSYNTELYEMCGSLAPILTGLPFKTETGISLKFKNTEYVPEVINSNGELTLNTNGEIEMPGNFDLISKTSDSTMSSIAFNFNRNESDTRNLDNETFAELCEQNGAQVFSGSPEKLSTEISKNVKGTPLWKWCIIFVLFFLLIEILLIRFFKNNAKLSA